MTLSRLILDLLDFGFSRGDEQQELENPGFIPQTQTSPPDIGLVRGQRSAKQALLIAAAGGHNLLMVGPPGEGKSFLASSLPGFLPRLTISELEALQYIYGASNLPLPMVRPFRAVGPTITPTSLIGGGRSKLTLYPGEISLAHAGVLFLDELPQFGRQLIDSLRTPLESGIVSISRGGSSVVYPAQCQLVAAMNPCPCGYLGSSSSEPSSGRSLCICPDYKVAQYRAAISGPILDRIDLIVHLDSLSSQERFSVASPNQSGVFLNKVCQARQAMRRRTFNTEGYKRGDCYNLETPYMLNRDLGAKEVFDERSNYLGFTTDSLNYFKIESSKPRYSTRKTVRLARISRTIADLSNHTTITTPDIHLAAGYVDSDLIKD